MKKHIISTFLLFAFLYSTAQKEKNIWYFGDGAGLDFSSGAPVVLSNSAMLTYDNSASICDSETGNLLFYSNGVNIWNRNHQVMTNGSGLLGNNSAGNSAFAVKQPGNSNLYYLFTNDAFAGINGLRYSVIDMSLNNGLGAVTSSKNISLLNPSTEKITAIKHANNQDIWIITHAWNSNSFNAYLLSSTGLKTSPVTTSIGSVHTGGTSGTYNALGQITANKKGDRIAVAIYELNTFELFNFNRATGTLSNYISIPDMVKSWGTEFSPDGKLLYKTQWGGPAATEIKQFDLSSNDAETIKKSGKSVGVVTGPDVTFKAGYLQLGPDEKIYVAKFKSDYIGVIDSPNKVGNACNYKDDGVYLGGKICQAGLPSFMQTETTISKLKEELNSEVITLSPNPFSTHLTISSQTELTGCLLKIYDSMGKLAHMVDNLNGKEFQITRDNLKCGMYYLCIFNNNNLISSNKIIIAD